MADSTLAAIRTKVRRLTRSPSEAQLSTAQIDEYVNTFVLYDFPEHLRLFDLRKTLTFYTDPYIDTYETTTLDPAHPLYDFKNRYITTHNPVYVGGYEIMFSQSREQFFGLYPFNNSIVSIGTGDGVTTAYAGTLSGVPVLRNNVTFSSIDLFGVGLAVYDDGLGGLVGDVTGPGVINYVTGTYAFTFNSTPDVGAFINSQTVPYQPARPNAMCYFDNSFIFRSVPDQSYPVNLEVYKRPTELLDGADNPDINQWWQWIAYGTAKKVFEDRMDLDSVQLIMPEYKKQETLVLRKTIVQQTKERTATLYTQQNNLGYYGW